MASVRCSRDSCNSPHEDAITHKLLRSARACAFDARALEIIASSQWISRRRDDSLIGMRANNFPCRDFEEGDREDKSGLSKGYHYLDTLFGRGDRPFIRRHFDCDRDH